MDPFKAKGQAPTRCRMSNGSAAPVALKIDYGKKIIRGISAMTRGPSLGWDAWIDATLLAQVAASGNSFSRGVKSRFTHPGLSSDGLGTLLGRAKSFRVEDDQVLCDLHLLDSAEHTPKGDLSTYVMQLADESPDLAAFSIVFTRDMDAESAFIEKHQVEQKPGQKVFVSPDEDNAANDPHFRLEVLHDVDLVDEPAANPDGMFSAPDILLQGRESLLYVLGISEEKPQGTFGGIDLERIRRFSAETLARDDIVIVKVQTEEVIVPEGEIQREEVSEKMPTDTKEKDAKGLSGDSPPDSKAILAAERERTSRIRELAETCDQVELGNQLIDDGTDAIFAGQKILAAQGKATAELAKMPDPAASLRAAGSPGADGEPERAAASVERDDCGSPSEKDVDAYLAKHSDLTFGQAAMALAGPDKVKRGAVQ